MKTYWRDESRQDLNRYSLYSHGKRLGFMARVESAPKFVYSLHDDSSITIGYATGYSRAKEFLEWVLAG